MNAPSREISSITLKEKRVHISIFYVPTCLIPRLLLRSCSAVPWPVKMVHYFPKKEWFVVGKIQNALNLTRVSRFNAMEISNAVLISFSSCTLLLLNTALRV